MSAKELFNRINSLESDIEFEYKGVHGAVCPFSREDISISYGDVEKTHTSIADVMEDRIFDGKSLNEIANKIDLY